MAQVEVAVVPGLGVLQVAADAELVLGAGLARGAPAMVLAAAVVQVEEVVLPAARVSAAQGLALWQVPKQALVHLVMAF